MWSVVWFVCTVSLLDTVLLGGFTPSSALSQERSAFGPVPSQISQSRHRSLTSAANSAPVPTSAPVLLTNSLEAAALRVLRYDLGIRRHFWRRGGDPCSTWVGVVCEGGHVVGIRLSGLKRTVSKASQPVLALDSLLRFPLLRSLDASGFPLPGSLPDWFGRLSNLQRVDLTLAFINGSIPSSIGELSNLQTLIMADNNLTGNISPSLGNLSNLKVLDLSSNGLTGKIPATFSSLQNLRMLNLSRNKLTGEVSVDFARLTKLQALVLANNALEGSIPTELGNLSALSNLDLGSNALSGPIPPQLGKLQGLHSLILSNNLLNGSIPPETTNCTDLKMLLLDRNSLTGTLPAAFHSLRNLSILNLSSNNLTGILPTGLSSLSQVKEVIVSHNLFYGTLPAGLTSLPVLQKLDFSYNYLDGPLPAPLLSGALFELNCFSGSGNQRTFDACQLFYFARGFPFEGAIPSPSGNMQTAVALEAGKSNRLGVILGGVFGALGVLLIIMALVVFVLKRERGNEPVQQGTATALQKGGTEALAPSLSVNLLSLGENFTFSQLQQATGEFKNLLKAGHSGDLYHGVLEGGFPIVVKRIELSRFKRDSYLSELELFGKASHTRFVPLLGHCLELEAEKILVYKYMPNQDLASALHRKANGSPPEEALQSLDWITRLKVAIGAAEGLTFLHHECTPPLVHRDIQASSILLDDKFEVRLGSLAEACVAEGDSHHGVIARLFHMSHENRTSEQGETGASVPSCAYDVYCFGKVLLELVSGKLGISGSNFASMDAWIEWALSLINIYDKEAVTKIVDPSLIVDEDLLEEVWAMAIVAKSCLNPKPSKRPLMRYILKALENPLKVVREDAFSGSNRPRTSSQRSWNSAFFGSWRHSSSETAFIPGSLREEYLHKNSSKQLMNGGSQGSVQGDVSHRRPGSNEIFPEPIEQSTVQAPNTDAEKHES